MWTLSYQFHYKDTELIEQPDWQGDDQKGENISSRGDDGGNDEDCHDGMTSITTHEAGADKMQTAKDCTYNGEFKNYAHD